MISPPMIPFLFNTGSLEVKTSTLPFNKNVIFFGVIQQSDFYTPPSDGHINLPGKAW